jgi:hypothetical protein
MILSGLSYCLHNAGLSEIGKSTFLLLPLVSKLTLSLTFSYFDSDTGFGVPRYPYAFSVDGDTSLLSQMKVIATFLFLIYKDTRGENGWTLGNRESILSLPLCGQ